MTATLTVDRDALMAALKFLKPYIRPKKPKEAAFVYDDGVLVIQAGPVSARARAAGTWQGTAWCSGLIIPGLFEGLPSTEQVKFSVEEDRLHVGNYSFNCRWEARRDIPISLPLNASTNLILSLRLRYTEAELTRAGLVAELRRAEDRRDRALSAAARELLALEITKFDLMTYLDERLRRTYLGETDNHEAADKL